MVRHSIIRICVGIAALALASMTAAADPLLIKTEHGKIRGKSVNQGAVRAFLGIPYAAPPVGELRWMPPRRMISRS